MSMQACINVIKKSAGEGKIDNETAMNLLSEIDDYITAFKNSTKTADDMDAALAQHLKGKWDQSMLAAVVEKRNAMINLAVEAKATAFLGTFANKADGLAALMGGIIKSQYKGKLSIDASGKALANKYIGRLVDRIEKDGDLALFNSGQLDRDVMKELWEIRPGGKPGVTGNAAAERVARHIHTMQDAAVKHANQAGAYINQRPGYIFRQSHNMAAMRKAGFDEWYNFIITKLDQDATFNGADPKKFLEGAYNGLITGVHYKARGADVSNHLYGFKGPANLAKRMSQERLLHFKSGDDFFEYNLKFGNGDLREGVVHGLEHMARNTALMRGLGTNPVAMFDRLRHKAVMEAQAKGDVKAIEDLNAGYLTNLLKEIDGTTRIPGNVSIARVNAGIRMIQNMARLGGAVVSSVTDIPNQAAELRFQGKGVMSAYAGAFSNIFRGRGSAEQKTIARLMGVGFDGVTGDLMSRFGANDHLPGTMSKLQQKFFKFNLMTWWNDSHRTGMGLMMSTMLADNASKNFSDLGPRLTNIFDNYGIGEAEWNLYRQHGLKQASNGVTYMVSEGLEALDDATIKTYLKGKGNNKPTARQIETARNDLVSMLDTFYIDRADSGIPMPGAAEKAIMNQGTQAGTVVGEAFRHFMQFKSFPITALRRGVGRELHGGVNGRADIMGLAQLIVGTTVFGYGAMYMKDLLKGRTPRTFTGDLEKDSKLFFAAMSQGGGLGIYGDFLFGEYSRYGRSFLATAAGPTLGQLDDIAEIWTRIRTGEDVAARVVQQALNNTPFVNLFYTRAALDYLILYQLQEMVNPGYLRRMENRIMRENDQRFFVPPSSQIPYGGGDRIFEGVR